MEGERTCYLVPFIVLGYFVANSDISEMATRQSPRTPAGLMTGCAPQINQTSQTNAMIFHEPQNIKRGNFMQTFTSMLVADELGAHMAPFILKDGVLLCRISHFDHFTQPRYRNFFDMMDTARRRGLHDLLPTSEPIPLIFFPADHNGCNVADKQDRFGFPRLTMSYIADKHSNTGCAVTTPTEKKGCKWCKTVPIPTNVVWSWIKMVNHSDPSGWDKEFDLFNEKYPWDEKLRKAVWRGTSTVDISQYGDKPLKEIPRGRVVQTGIDRPGLIDAAFVKVLPRYSRWENTTRLADERMPFEDQMNYIAIIDVDGKFKPFWAIHIRCCAITIQTNLFALLCHAKGNNWSSRFPKLLCLNR